MVPMRVSATALAAGFVLGLLVSRHSAEPDVVVAAPQSSPAALGGVCGRGSEKTLDPKSTTTTTTKQDDDDEEEEDGTDRRTGNRQQQEEQQQQQRERRAAFPNRERHGRRLKPSDLPLPKLFDGFDSDTTLAVAGRELTVRRGSILQQGMTDPSTAASSVRRTERGGGGTCTTNTTNNNNDNRFTEPKEKVKKNRRAATTATRSELVVLPGLVPRSVVSEMLALLRGHEDADVANGTTTVRLDGDPDSVDGMASQEIFLDNDSLRRGLPSKSDPTEDMAERENLRERLRTLTGEYSHAVLPMFLNEWYGPERCGRPGRTCTPCYSLIRRYRAGERQSHAPHHDAHSFVTVVISLVDYGDEYNGGLYVSTKSSERNFVGLDRGDAVVHQGDLHHGVKVSDRRDDGKPSERWSWILWFRDSDACEDHGSKWHARCASAGNPTCMYLQANHGRSVRDKISWNERASDAGHAQASVKLAYAYLKALPSHLEFDREKARDLFERAVDSSNEPDGHYGMAMLHLAATKLEILNLPTNEEKQEAAVANLGSPIVMEAIYHLEEAAIGGHVFAMFNLGICYSSGYDLPGDGDGGMRRPRPDATLAMEWFEASGLPEGYHAKALLLKLDGNHERALEFRDRARGLGYGAPWRKTARRRTGSGGSGGADLNLPWPPLPGGRFPPEW